MRRILVLARAEVLHVTRDRMTLAQILVMPVVQLLLLSNAATFAIRDTPAYIVDFDRSRTSRELVRRLAASERFRILGQSASPELADQTILAGRAAMVVTIPSRFEESLVRTGRAAVQIALNAERGSTAGIVQFYASRILADYSSELAVRFRPTVGEIREGGEAPASGSARIDVRARHWYNATLNYQHYMVPGILVMLVTLVGTLLAAQNIAREKELGTLEQLNVTPITRGQFIAAKLLPFWVLGLVILAMGLIVGRMAFAIPVRGSLLLLFGVAAVYLVVGLAIGLFISTVVDTQQQAMFVTFFVLTVYLLMSGLFTPIDSMAPWVQVVSQANPLRHFVTISRAILVKGAGPAEIARPLVLLVVYAAVMFALAVRQYSKRTA
jgi:ABC-2 type transport system permease protein